MKFDFIYFLEGSKVYEVIIIPIIGDFMYDKVRAQHTDQLNFAPGVKIKNWDLLLHPRIPHCIIKYNIMSKKKHYDEVIFMNICLIYYIIRGCHINLPYIMMNNIIMPHDQKQKSLPYSQCLNIVFEYFDILLTNIDKNPYSKAMEIDIRALTKMG